MYSIREERFVCPHCGDTWPSLSGAAEHAAICEHNPTTHMCASCTHVGKVTADEELEGVDIKCLCRHALGVDDIRCLYETNTCKHHTPRDPSGRTACRIFKFTYVCPYCGLHMGDMADMLKHIDACIHNPDAVKKTFTCKYCELMGSDLDIRCHTQVCMYHPGNKRCKTCKYFELDSYGEVTCLCTTSKADMGGLVRRCPDWKLKEKAE